MSPSEDVHKELRLFLEGVCCDLVRFRHVHDDGVAPEDVRIRQEVFLGSADSYADIRVDPPSGRPYFVEIKTGYPPDKIVRSLERKYGTPASVSPTADAARVIVVVDSIPDGDFEPGLRQAIPPTLEIELWDQKRVFSLLREIFALEIESWEEHEIVDVQLAIDQAKGRYAFGDDFKNDPLQSSLLWHFSFWELKKLYESRRSARAILPPGLYRGVVAIFADLSSFSSFVRDTRDDRIVRYALTSFYAKTRYQVLNAGGLMYQFLGDGAVALFGVPEGRGGYVESALECARALIDIGASVSSDWQRQIDHVQSAGGAHVGVAMGDLNIVSLRPFSRAHLSAIADSINTAARLSGAAGNHEIVASNTFYQALPDAARASFAEMAPVEARNIGKIRSWKWGAAG